MKEYLAILLPFLIGISGHHEVHLVPADKICPDVSPEHNILLPDPHDCSVFYKCENGTAIPQSCPPGLEWCQILQNCTLPILANCSISHTIVTYSPEELATYNPNSTTDKPTGPVPNDETCPEDDVVLPYPGDCHKYYKCVNGRPHEENCPENEQFSTWIGICTAPEIANCIIKPQENKTCPVNGASHVYPADCNQYYECVDKNVEIKECPSGEKYNEWFKICTSPELAYCHTYTTVSPTTSSSTFPATTKAPTEGENVCPEPGAKLPNPLNCNTYFVCVNDTPEEQQCPEGFEYSCWDQECLPPTDSECLPTEGNNCKAPGQKLPNADDCGSYFECNNSVTVKVDCQNGLNYNAWYEKCVDPDLAHCSEKPTTTTLSTIDHSGTPTPSVSDNICPEDDFTLPDLFDCHSYYICRNSTPVKEECPEGKDYSCWDQECLPSETVNCINNVNETDDCGKENNTMPNSEDCSSYFICVNGKVVLENCEEDLEYNAWFGKCVDSSESHCPLHTTTNPTTTPITTESTESTTIEKTTTKPPNPLCPKPDLMYPSPHYCNAFMKCDKDRQLQTIICNPRQFHYNCETKKCENITHCCSHVTATMTPGPTTITETTKITETNPTGTEGTGTGDTEFTSSGYTGSIETSHSEDTGGTGTGPTESSGTTGTSHSEDTGGTGTGPTESSGTTGTSHSEDTGGTGTGPTESSGTTGTSYSEDTGGTGTGPTESSGTTGTSHSEDTGGTGTGPTESSGTTGTSHSENTGGTGTGPTDSSGTTGTSHSEDTGGTGTGPTESSGTTGTSHSEDTGGTGTGPTESSGTTGTSHSEDTGGTGTGPTESSGTTGTSHSEDTGGTGTGPTESSGTTGTSHSEDTGGTGTGPTESSGTTGTSHSEDTGGTGTGPTESSGTTGTSHSEDTGGTGTGPTESSGTTETSHSEDTGGTGTGPTESSGTTGTSHSEDTGSTGTGPTESSGTTGTSHSEDTSDTGTGPTESSGTTGTSHSEDTGGTGTGPTESSGTTGTSHSEDTGGTGTGPTESSGTTGTSHSEDTGGTGTGPTESSGTTGTSHSEDTGGTGTGPTESSGTTGTSHSEDTGGTGTGPTESSGTTGTSHSEDTGGTGTGPTESSGTTGTSHSEDTGGTGTGPTESSGTTGTSHSEDTGGTGTGPTESSGTTGTSHSEDTGGTGTGPTESSGTTGTSHSEDTGGTGTGPTESSGTTGTSYSEDTGGTGTGPTESNGTTETSHSEDTGGTGTGPTESSGTTGTSHSEDTGGTGTGPTESSGTTGTSHSEDTGGTGTGPTESSGTTGTSHSEDTGGTGTGPTESSGTTGTSHSEDTGGTGTGPTESSGTTGTSHSEDTGGTGTGPTESSGTTGTSHSEDTGGTGTGPTESSGTTGTSHSEDTGGTGTGPTESSGTTGTSHSEDTGGTGTGPTESGGTTGTSHSEDTGGTGTSLSNGTGGTATTPTEGPGCKNPSILCSKPGLQYPSSSYCNAYMKCDNNCQLKTIICNPPQFHYNCETKKCENTTHCCSRTNSTLPPDSTTKTEITDTTGTTPTTTTSGSCPLDGAILPNPLDCHSYFACDKDTIVSKKCPDEQIYSCWDQQCEKSESATCINEGSQEGEPCSKEGVKQQNIEDCGSYYQCVDGKITLKKCPKDNTYDIWLKECKPANSADCKTYPTVKPNHPTKVPPPTTISPSPIENVCPFEGALLPNPLNCSTYYKCIGTEPTLESCPSGQGYSCWNQRCETGAEDECNPTGEIGQACSIEGLILPNTGNCDGYLKCQNGTIVQETCPPGKEFNAWFGKCMESKLSHCQTVTSPPSTSTTPTTTPSTGTTPTTAPGSCPLDGAILPNPLACHSYFACDKDTIVSKKCPDGQIYSCWDQQCEKSESATCINEGSQEEEPCSKEGVKQQNIEDCGSYYQCVDGKITLKKCPKDNTYDIWLKECKPANSADCKTYPTVKPNHPTKVPPPTTISPSPIENVCPFEGALLPNPLNCSTYYKCIGTEPTLESCPSGQGYSCWNQRCETGAKDECNPTGEIGQACSIEGLILPNTENCGGYLKCQNGTIVQETCPPGKEFNPWFEKCMESKLSHCQTATSPPSTGTTPTTTPSTGTTPTTAPGSCPLDGAILPNPLDCRSYFTCDKDTIVSKKCPDGQIYSCWDQQCEKSESATCINEGSQEGEPCSKEGVKQQNIEDCGSYYQCVDGNITLKECPKDNTYDIWLKECKPANSADCKTYPTVKPNHPTNGPPPTTISPSSTENVCPFEGALLPNPLNCSTYYKCIGTEPTLESCPSGQGYSCWNQRCETGAEDECNPTGEIGQACSIEGLILPNTGNCGGYLECQNGTIVQETCPSGTEFNAWFEKCMESKLSHCHTATSPPSTPPTDPTAPNEGYDVCPVEGAFIPNPIDCKTYYKCINGTPTLENCPDGNKYSCWDQKCELDSEATCVSEGSQNGNNCSTNGLRVTVVTNCNSYYECDNGTIILKHCPPGEEFNSAFKDCYQPKLAHCVPQTTVAPPDTTVTPPPKPTPGPNDVCPVDGSLLPNPLNCSAYFKCVNSTPTPQLCADGYEYSCWDEECEPAGEATCIAEGNHTGSSCKNNGQRNQNPEDCHSYYECEDGKVVLKRCKLNWFYNRWFKFCVPFSILAHCTPSGSTIPPPTTPKPTPPISETDDVCPIDGALLPDPLDCTKYYKCENNKPTPQKCPSGQEYSCWDQECKAASDAKCINDGVQLGQTCSREGEKLPNIESCNSYYECKNGIVEKKYCFILFQYNQWYQRCVLSLYAHCKTAPVITTTVATPLPPNPTPSDEYDICPVEGALLPSPVDCTAFYKCINGTPTLQKCPDGMEYSCWDQKCKLDANADCIAEGSQLGANCTVDGLRLANIEDCSSYYECHNGKAVLKHCDSGKEFNDRFQDCYPPKKAHCHTYSTIVPPTGTIPTSPVPGNDICPVEGALLPNPVNCSTYFKCINGTPTLKLCADGFEYSCWNQECEPAGEAQCVAVEVPVGEKCDENGQKIPDPTDCQKYYECVKHVKVLKECPHKLFYNKWFGTCVHKHLAYCNETTTIKPSKTPPTTVEPPSSSDTCPHNNAVIPNPDDCSSYYKCEKKKPVLKKCPKNKKYSPWDQECKKESEVQCVNVGSPLGKNCSRDGVIIQNLESCTSYFECENGIVQEYYCFLGFKFNRWYQSCQLNPFAHCRTYTTIAPPEPETTTSTTEAGNSMTTVNYPNKKCSKNGAKFPKTSNCNQYYQCNKKSLTLFNCKPGNNYDCWDQECSPVSQAKCVNEPQSWVGQSCTKEGDSVPDPTDCRKYYICRGKTIRNKDCPTFKRYDVLEGKCVEYFFATCANAIV